MNNNIVKRNTHIARYERYLSKDPENVVLLTTLGNLYHQSGLLSDAIRCFKNCLLVDKNNRIAKICMARIFVSANRFELSEKLLRSVFEQDKKDAIVVHELALSLYYQQRWDDALDVLSSAQLKDQDSVRYATYCLHHKRHYWKALFYAKQWISSDASDDKKAYLSLLEMDGGSFLIAKRRALLVLQSQPKSVDANIVLGLWFIHADNIDRAYSYFKTALQYDKNNVRLSLYLIFCNIFQHNYAKAIERLHQLANSETTYTLLAWINLFQANNEAAQKYFYDAIAAATVKNESSYGGLAIAQALQREQQEASEYIAITQEINADSVLVSYTQYILAAAKPYTQFNDVISDSEREGIDMMEHLKRYVLSAAEVSSYLRPNSKKHRRSSGLTQTKKEQEYSL